MVQETTLHFQLLIQECQCHQRRSVLSAAMKLRNAATVNQRLSWVFQELNLSFLFLEVKSPSVPRTPKEAAAAVIQGK